ncbi:hypothetical protein QYE76_067566 [Lolium multiflorum]|uniref:Uncharacterized protein n=1 Tax=Lolium multiflorum TaxID=4521 RepID=A0AAD8SCN1_LOLMU|nr:hypothetical protein QYE76_067566 [Lolium multiflorum]
MGFAAASPVEQCASIALAPNNPLQQHLEDSESEVFREERNELDEIFLRQPILKHDLPVEDLGTTPPPKEDHVFDLKPLPDNLKYAYIDDKKTYLVIISAKLSDFEEERLLEILKKHRGAIGYTLDDLKGISPSICQHAINMEDDAKPVVEHQRRLIPKMKDVMSSQGSSSEDYATRRQRELLQDLDQGTFVGWAEEERVVTRRKEMDEGVNEEVKKMSSIKRERKPGSKPILVGSVNTRRSFSHNLQGPLPPAPDLNSFPAAEEALRVTDEFCDQYRVLRREVEILQDENNRLRRMLERFLTPIRVVPPSPPKE